MVGDNMKQRILLTILLILFPTFTFAQAIGPSIGDELQAAGVSGLPFAWNPQTGQVRTDDPRLTEAQRATIQAVFAAHNPTKLSTEQMEKQAKVKAKTGLIAHCASVEADTTQPVTMRQLCGFLKQALP